MVQLDWRYLTKITVDIPRESRLNYCQDLVIKKLPDQNYVVLKYLLEFLCLVTDRFALEQALTTDIYLLVIFRCDMNKMTAANLAVVFGPNLAWPNDKVNYPNFSHVLLSIIFQTMSLQYIGHINTFTQFLIDNMYEVFII